MSALTGSQEGGGVKNERKSKLPSKNKVLASPPLPKYTANQNLSLSHGPQSNNDLIGDVEKRRSRTLSAVNPGSELPTASIDPQKPPSESISPREASTLDNQEDDDGKVAVMDNVKNAATLENVKGKYEMREVNSPSFLGNTLLSDRQRKDSRSNLLLLKVHYPMVLWKVVQLDRETTVRDAMIYIAQKKADDEFDEDTVLNDYGLFIPAWYGNEKPGWLDLDKTLGFYQLKSMDVVEFRPKFRTLPIHNRHGKTVECRIADTETLWKSLPEIVRKVGVHSVIRASDCPFVDHRVLLDKGVLPLHLPLPESAEILLRKDSEPRDEEDDELQRNFSVHVRLPTFEGWLWKRSEKGKGLKGRSWKRRYFRLVKDKLIYFRSNTDQKPIGFVPVQRTREVSRVECVDAFTRRSPESCFTLETTDRQFLFFSPDSRESWISVLNEWFGFRMFFGPERWVSQQYFDRAFRENFGRKGSVVRRSCRMKALSIRVDPATALAVEAALREIDRTETKDGKLSQSTIEAAAAKVAAAAAAAAAQQQQSAPNANPLELKNKDTTGTAATTANSTTTSTTPSGTSTTLGEGNSDVGQADGSGGTTEVGDEDAFEVETEINIQLVDGVIQPMIVDAAWEVYDLVYSVAEEIGSANAHLITPADSDVHRRVELLDHQKSLGSQCVPSGATFLLKKTGIVDDFIGPNDIYDNHFLYVRLPYYSGFMLKRGVVPPHTGWRKRWFALKGSKLYYYELDTDTQHIGVIALHAIEEVKESDYVNEHASPISQLGLQLVTSCRMFHLIAPDKEQRNRWFDLINGWREYWRANCSSLDLRRSEAELRSDVDDIDDVRYRLVDFITDSELSLSAPILKSLDDAFLQAEKQAENPDKLASPTTTKHEPVGALVVGGIPAGSKRKSKMDEAGEITAEDEAGLQQDSPESFSPNSSTTSLGSPVPHSSSQASLVDGVLSNSESGGESSASSPRSKTTFALTSDHHQDRMWTHKQSPSHRSHSITKSKSYKPLPPQRQHSMGSLRTVVRSVVDDIGNRPHSSLEGTRKSSVRSESDRMVSDNASHHHASNLSSSPPGMSTRGRAGKDATGSHSSGNIAGGGGSSDSTESGDLRAQMSKRFSKLANFGRKRKQKKSKPESAFPGINMYTESDPVPVSPRYNPNTYAGLAAASAAVATSGTGPSALGSNHANASEQEGNNNSSKPHQTKGNEPHRPSSPTIDSSQKSSHHVGSEGPPPLVPRRSQGSFSIMNSPHSPTKSPIRVDSGEESGDSKERMGDQEKWEGTGSPPPVPSRPTLAEMRGLKTQLEDALARAKTAEERVVAAEAEINRLKSLLKKEDNHDDGDEHEGKEGTAESSHPQGEMVSRAEYDEMVARMKEAEKQMANMRSVMRSLL